MNTNGYGWKRATVWAGILLMLGVPGCAKEKQPETAAPVQESPAAEPAAPEQPIPKAEAKDAAPPPRRAEAKPAQETVRKTVPVGTSLSLTLETDLATDSSQMGDTFEATVSEPVIIDNLSVIPAGSVITGVLTDVKRAKRLKGGASITLAFREIRLPGGYKTELAATLKSEGEKTGKKSAAIIGGSAVGGAILGRVIGEEGKDAAIGSIIGGAIGAGVAATRDKELRVPAGTGLVVVTEAPLRIPVKVKVEGA